MPPDGVVVGERRGQQLDAMPLEESGVGLAGQERRVTERADQKVAIGGDTVDAGSGQRGREGGGGLRPAGRVDDDLGQHRVVVGAHHAARLDPLSTRTPRSDDPTSNRWSLPVDGSHSRAGSSA